MINRIIIICLFFLHFQSSVFSQNERLNYQLLWKITGNGLSSPSYIFGTMHLSDERVFDFSDSVLASLVHCKGFAMEVLPDSAMSTQILNYFAKKKESESSIKNYLSNEEYKKVTDQLKKNGKSFENLDNKSPKYILELLKGDKLYKHDRSTFLDAYLYRIALGERIQTIGLEDLKDQMDLLNEEDDIASLKGYLQGNYTNNPENNLINTYWKGDLAGIEQYFVGMDEVYLDKLLIRRNVNMIEKAIPLMQEKSFFIAVGAAHLPGEKGMIQLLRNKGYSVTPVPASFTGIAKKYQEKPFSETWIKYESPEMGYTIEAPSYPAKLNSAGADHVPFKMNLSADIKTGLFYFYMAIQAPERSNEESEKVLQEIFKNMNAKNGKNNSKKIIYKGYHGRAGQINKNSMYFKVRAIERKNCLYMVMVGSQMENNLLHGDVNKFFESLQFLNFGNPSWNTFKSEEGAFSVKTPHAFQEQTIQNVTETGGKVKTHLFVSGDLQKGIEYVLAYYQFAAGLVMNNDSTTFANAASSISDLLKGSNIKMEDSWLGEYKGKKYSFAMDANRRAEGRFYMRGNRLYNQLIVFPEGASDKTDVYTFLESFRFENYKKPELKPYTNKDYHFNVVVPSEVIADIDSLESPRNDIFNFQDPNSASAYLISVLYLSPYDYIFPDSLASRIKENYVGEDSILTQKAVTIQGIKGISLLIKQKHTKSLKQMLVVPKDDKLFLIFGYFPPADTASLVTKTFFSTFTFTEKNPTTHFYTNKTKKLLSDLTADDSTKKAEAKNYLYKYTFLPKETMLLKDAISLKYEDDTILYNTRSRLINALFRSNDTGIVGFMKQLYPSLKPYPELQIKVLNELIQSLSQEGLEFTLKALTEEVPKVEQLPYSFFYPLTDSLQLGAKLFPEMYFLSKESLFQDEIYSMATTLLDSNKISTEFFTNDLNKLVVSSNEILQQLKKKNADENYQKNRLLHVYAEFLQHFSGKPFIDQFFLSLSKEKNPEHAMDGVKGLAMLKKAIPPTSIEALASNQKYRVALFDLMHKVNQEQLISEKYRTQLQMAEGYLSTYMEYEDMGDGKCKFIKSEEKEYKTKKSRFYLFKVNYGKETYPALVGPFDLISTNITILDDATTIQYEEFEEEKTDAYFHLLLGE